jgi:hypothetical protein
MGTIMVILLVLIVAFVVAFLRKKPSASRRKHSSSGYTPGRKHSNCLLNDNNDLWIHQQNGGGRFAALVNTTGSVGGVVYEVKMVM